MISSTLDQIWDPIFVPNKAETHSKQVYLAQTTNGLLGTVSVFEPNKKNSTNCQRSNVFHD